MGKTAEACSSNLKPINSQGSHDVHAAWITINAVAEAIKELKKTQEADEATEEKEERKVINPLKQKDNGDFVTTIRQIQEAAAALTKQCKKVMAQARREGYEEWKNKFQAGTNRAKANMFKAL